MAYITQGSNSQTVTVATEVALAQTPVNPAAIPAGASVNVSGVVQCAAGTGGTAATVRVRQGAGTGGTALTVPAATVVSPAATANTAAVVPFSFVDPAPPANGVYTVTVAFAGNTSSVVSSIIQAEFVYGELNN